MWLHWDVIMSHRHISQWSCTEVACHPWSRHKFEVMALRDDGRRATVCPGRLCLMYEILKCELIIVCKTSNHVHSTLYNHTHCTTMHTVQPYTLYDHTHCTTIHIVHPYTLYNHTYCTTMHTVQPVQCTPANAYLMLSLSVAVYNTVIYMYFFFSYNYCAAGF